MYPDLSYLFHDLLGTTPDNWLSIFKTFGFFMAIAFLVSAMVYRAELARKAQEGYFESITVRVIEGLPASMTDILINALAGFFSWEKVFMPKRIMKHSAKTRQVLFFP